MAKSSTRRARNFATVIYPESEITGWRLKLEELCIPAFISPLHDQDIDHDGHPKKSHYHVVFMFDSVKTLEQAFEVVQTIGGVGCEVISTLRGYARYLCHLDSPDKHQYLKEDVISLSGSDYFEVIGLASDKYTAISEMIDFCEANKVVSYSDLLIYCRSHRNDWFRVLCDNGTYVIKEYLKSRSWTNKRIDLETGEILD